MNVWREGGGEGGGGGGGGGGRGRGVVKNLFIGSMRRQRIYCENRQNCNTKKIFAI